MEIAVQCPIEGGSVVHRARSLYALIDADYDYYNSCIGIQALQNGDSDNKEIPHSSEVHTKSNPTNGWSVHPNPANDLLVFSNSTKTGGQIQLYSVIGEKMATWRINKDQVTIEIPTDHLPDGLYYLHFHKQGENVYSQKIIIAH